MVVFDECRELLSHLTPLSPLAEQHDDESNLLQNDCPQKQFRHQNEVDHQLRLLHLQLYDQWKPMKLRLVITTIPVCNYTVH